MTTITRMAAYAIGATVLMVLPGCGQEPADFDDEDWSFRCTQIGGCPADTDTDSGGAGGGGGLSNTAFLGHILGQGVYPLNNLPLDGTAHQGVSIDGIEVIKCIDSAGFVGAGVSEANPTLSVDATGKLQLKTMSRMGDPATACDVYDEYWIGSKWTISYDTPEATFQTTLTIQAITIDDDGAPLYEIWLDADTVPDDRSGPMPLCAYAQHEPGMTFEAYFIPNLGIDDLGGLTTANDTAFIGCISGSYGKTEYWGYKPFIPEIGMSGFEVANNAIRAEYCGLDTTYTVSGTKIWFQSIFTNDGPNPNAPPVNSDWELEAVWSSDPDQPALCVGTTRLPLYQPTPPSLFTCDSGETRPTCDSTYFNAPGAVLATWAWTGS